MEGSEYQWVYPFFGLTPAYRASLFSEMHEIVFNGQGGYNHDIVYAMPIWLRKFTFNKMKQHYDKQSEAVSKQTSIPNKALAKGPAIKKPTYSTKARK